MVPRPKLTDIHTAVPTLFDDLSDEPPTHKILGMMTDQGPRPPTSINKQRKEQSLTAPLKA
jgi:hypothetical protein